MDTSSSLKQLAIVGNGFDLAHGYNTTYGNFIRDIGDDFFAEYRKMLCLYCESDDSWHEFENRVLSFTGGIYLEKFKSVFDAEKAADDLNRYNEWFNC